MLLYMIFPFSESFTTVIRKLELLLMQSLVIALQNDHWVYQEISIFDLV